MKVHLWKCCNITVLLIFLWWRPKPLWWTPNIFLCRWNSAVIWACSVLWHLSEWCWNAWFSCLWSRGSYLPSLLLFPAHKPASISASKLKVSSSFLAVSALIALISGTLRSFQYVHGNLSSLLWRWNIRNMSSRDIKTQSRRADGNWEKDEQSQGFIPGEKTSWPNWWLTVKSSV